MEVYIGQHYVEKIVCEGKSTKVAHHHLSQTDGMFLLTRHISRPQVSYKILETGACRIFETPSVAGGPPSVNFPLSSFSLVGLKVIVRAFLAWCRGQQYIGRKISKADILALFRLLTTLLISKSTMHQNLLCMFSVSRLRTSAPWRCPGCLRPPPSSSLPSTSNLLSSRTAHFRWFARMCRILCEQDFDLIVDLPMPGSSLAWYFLLQHHFSIAHQVFLSIHHCLVSCPSSIEEQSSWQKEPLPRILFSPGIGLSTPPPGRSRSPRGGR